MIFFFKFLFFPTLGFQACLRSSELCVVKVCCSFLNYSRICCLCSQLFEFNSVGLSELDEWTNKILSLRFESGLSSCCIHDVRFTAVADDS